MCAAIDTNANENGSGCLFLGSCVVSWIMIKKIFEIFDVENLHK